KSLVAGVPHLVTAETLPCVGSDHNPVLLTVHVPPRHAAPRPRFNYNKADWARFGREVHGNLVIRRFNTAEEVDDGVHHLTTVIQNAMAQSIPSSSDKRSPDELPPHLTKLKTLKNAAKRRWLRNRLPDDRTAYNFARRMFQRKMTDWQNSKWTERLNKASNHTDVWKLAKAMKRTAHVTPPLTTATGPAYSAHDKAAAISTHFQNAHTQNDHMGDKTHTDQAPYVQN
ncbi:putative RNA-directed DNA polymerase from transposon X-element, partial [Frankliniella fusca]